MDIAYDLTIDDFVEFNVSHQRRSPMVRGITVSVIMVLWFVVAGAVALSVVLAPPESRTLVVCVLFAVVCVFSILVWREGRRVPSSGLSARIIRRFLTEGDISRMVGRYKLNVTATELTESSPQGESSCAMSAVQKIVVANQHAFIYFSPVQAFVVPRRAFGTSVDFESFVRMIEQHSGQSAILETR